MPHRRKIDPFNKSKLSNCEHHASVVNSVDYSTSEIRKPQDHWDTRINTKLTLGSWVHEIRRLWLKLGSFILSIWSEFLLFHPWKKWIIHHKVIPGIDHPFVVGVCLTPRGRKKTHRWCSTTKINQETQRPRWCGRPNLPPLKTQVLRDISQTKATAPCNEQQTICSDLFLQGS